MIFKTVMEKKLCSAVLHGRWEDVKKILNPYTVDPSERLTEFHFNNSNGIYKNKYLNKLLCITSKTSNTSMHNEVETSTLLHYVILHDAPLDVISMVVLVYPEYVLKQDQDGKIPLHIALEHGIHWKTIKFLVNRTVKDQVNHSDETSYNTFCFKDSQGKTPLHTFCESWIRYNYEDDLTKSSIKIFDMLVPDRVNPPIEILYEDFEGMTALEYAIMSEYPVKLIRKLQVSTKNAASKFLPNNRFINNEPNVEHQSYLSRAA